LIHLHPLVKSRKGCKDPINQYKTDTF